MSKKGGSFVANALFCVISCLLNVTKNGIFVSPTKNIPIQMNHTRFLFTCFLILGLGLTALAHESLRRHQLFDDGWIFALGDASDPRRDFGCGTEYFNYLTKANSVHNTGPYSLKFHPQMAAADSGPLSEGWHVVKLPHDWVVDLPFAAEASHSHGYKTVGWKYPTTSVGWYRKLFVLPRESKGRHWELQFDGIFRDARIWVNGFYVGGEPSGYISQIYDITEYVNPGDTNLVCVRADASLEEGWFYEGAGIYRHTWLNETAPLHVRTFGTFVHAVLTPPYDRALLTIETTVANDDVSPRTCKLRHVLTDADGHVVGTAEVSADRPIEGKDEHTLTAYITVDNPKLWSVETPYLYCVRTEVFEDEHVVDAYTTRTGIRHISFDADRGFLLNGKAVKLRGVNMHQDHAGVGAAIPDALQVWRLRQLKAMGCNAYRSSHNPMTPEVLDACDSFGILVLEENRLTGINDYQRYQLRQMIRRDRNHPSIILWSVGNEEWGIEWNNYGRRIGAAMREFVHREDPTRPACVASSSGPVILEPMDVAGYNYILSHRIDELRQRWPERCAVGTEETTGCGTRGIYFDDRANGRMVALNRSPQGPDSTLNCIERGWKFYVERPWLGGLFYWTGFDYRGEPNPLSFPATGSEFGILDYCGFPKDEAEYLRAWWTDQPVLHLLPHWNLSGHEGERIDIWAYSNCAEVELVVNGKRLSRQQMPHNGHLAWQATYQPGYIEARGYDKRGHRIITRRIETTDVASRIRLSADRTIIAADGRDVSVCRIELLDRRGRFVPTACEDVELEVSGPVHILGVGNGDPAFRYQEGPADPAARRFHIRTFNGLAQVLLQATDTPGTAQLTARSVGNTSTLRLTIQN